MATSETNFFPVRYEWTDAQGVKHSHGSVAAGPTPAQALANFQRENRHVRAELVNPDVGGQRSEVSGTLREGLTSDLCSLTSAPMEASPC